MSPTNITEIPPNGIVVRPVASLQRLLIQPNIFWPIIENSLIITYLTPFKLVCNLIKADDFNDLLFLPLIGSCRSEWRVVHIELMCFKVIGLQKG